MIDKLYCTKTQLSTRHYGNFKIRSRGGHIAESDFFRQATFDSISVGGTIIKREIK